MNWDQVEGNWMQMKGKVKETWGDLTDSDLTKIEGKRDRLAGALQERYGKKKEEVEKEIDTWLGGH
ncbi:MAG: CsbD family protein [Parvibaculaceae bacterium]|nr:CsbD family protein [Parvibaculaceae bacterium]